MIHILICEYISVYYTIKTNIKPDIHSSLTIWPKINKQTEECIEILKLNCFAILNKKSKTEIHSHYE